MSANDPYERLRDDPHLGPLVAEHGELSVEPHPDPFERLVVSIVNQQLSTESAAAIRERLFDRFEVTPVGLLGADEDELREVGLSGQKIRYVRNVAERFEDGLSVERLHELDDDAVVDELTQITGIGDWTAKMFLMFCLGREDVFPVEDLGIRRGTEQLFGDCSRAEMVDIAERWRPYRSYASRYLWRAVD
ncbi:DNA-3-methyladenine glycosylase family protein [Haloarchaeobius sp. TZWWS8]|uniref:DNA-3-methyladenine glycosylase family protein n=1 Tax=Haloarchaeobius sp. TZWWS8 TaxID=3446121 RepID=UPI003EB82EB7